MRVLITTTALIGHFHPLVPLATALRDDGNEVAFAAPPEFRVTVEDAGFPYFAAGDNPMADRDGQRLYGQIASLDMSSPDAGRRTNELMVEVFAGPSARMALRDLLPLCERWKPDVIVREEFEFAGALAAEVNGIPHVTVQLGIGGPEVSSAYPAIGRTLAGVRAEHGLTGDGLAELDRYLRLVFVPPTLLEPGVTLPPTAEILHPSIFDTSSRDSLPDWVGELDSRPTVYTTLGTALPMMPGIFPHAYRPLIDALAGEPVNAILTVGRDHDPARLGDLPENLHVAGYLPQTALLPHCAVVVCHSGFNTVLSALAEGLPMVLLPVAGDQPDTAQRAVDLGIAIRLPIDRRGADDIRAAVRELLSDGSYAERARAIRDEIAELPPVSHAAKLIAALV